MGWKLTLLCILQFFVSVAMTAAQEAPFTKCDAYAAIDVGPGQNKSGVAFDKIDPRVAIPACEEALRRYPGNKRLIFELGRSYSKSGNFAAALGQFQKAAEVGYPPALNALGVMYADGSGVPKDEREAVKWYRKAAEQGDVGGQLNLGFTYENGRGAPRDYSSAFEWYQKAAEQGSAQAQDSIAYFYAKGRGIKKDSTKAVAWFRKAAEQGMAGAQYNLGTMYEHGDGVTMDRSQALAWYMKAAEQGNDSAMKKISELAAISANASADSNTTDTPLPPIHNSPDTHCDYLVACTDDQFTSLATVLQRQWALTPEWLRVKCVSNSTFPSMENCILSETVSSLNTNPNEQAPWVNPDNFRPRQQRGSEQATKPNVAAVTARGVSVVPGAIVCPDLNTVDLMFDLYANYWSEAMQDSMTHGESRLIRGEPAPKPQFEMYGCALLPPGTPMTLEGGHVVPVVTAKLPDGKTIRGVTLPSMIVGQMAAANAINQQSTVNSAPGLAGQENAVSQSSQSQLNGVPQELWGKWTIDGEIPTSTIACWGEREAKSIIGTQIEYGPEIFRWKDIVTQHPSAEMVTVSAAQFHEENSGHGADSSQVTFRQLGIKGAATTEVTIKHPDANITGATTEIPGDVVLMRDKNIIVFSVCNVYFEARRNVSGGAR